VFEYSNAHRKVLLKEVNLILEQGMKVQSGSTSVALLFWYLQQMVVCGQHHAPGTLPWDETQYPLYRKLGGPQDQSEQVWKFLPPLGLDPTVQNRVRCYTNYAIPAQETNPRN